MHPNVNIPMHLRSNITKCWPKNGITGNYWGFWGHYTVYFCNYLLLLLIFFHSFPDKNLWFSSQRRREGVVWMLMTISK